MEYYVKQRVFTVGDKYDIYDEDENPVFHVEREIFAFTLHLYDQNYNLLYLIRRRFFSFLPTYDIYKNDECVASVRKSFLPFIPKFNIDAEDGDYTIEGELMAHDFSIYKDGVPVATVHKKWLSWGDTYEIDIQDNSNIPFYLSLVIVIDNCLHDGRKAGK